MKVTTPVDNFMRPPAEAAWLAGGRRLSPRAVEEISGTEPVVHMMFTAWGQDFGPVHPRVIPRDIHKVGTQWGQREAVGWLRRLFTWDAAGT